VKNVARIFLSSLAVFFTVPVLAQDTVTAPETTCDPKIEQANLTLFQAYLQDLTTSMGQFDRTLYWSSEATLDIPGALPYGGHYTFAKFPNYESALMKTWRFNATMKPPMLYATCDKVFLYGSWDATALATGKSVTQPLLEVFTFQEGKISNDTFFFFDVQEVVNALEP
jgi:ketosteroid isomerase-like protein